MYLVICSCWYPNNIGIVNDQSTDRSKLHVNYIQKDNKKKYWKTTRHLKSYPKLKATLVYHEYRCSKVINQQTCAKTTKATKYKKAKKNPKNPNSLYNITIIVNQRLRNMYRWKTGVYYKIKRLIVIVWKNRLFSHATKSLFSNSTNQQIWYWTFILVVVCIFMFCYYVALYLLFNVNCMVGNSLLYSMQLHACTLFRYLSNNFCW